MKTVNYRGMTFEIEECFKYIATDEDGAIFAYVNLPVRGRHDWLNAGGDLLILKDGDKSWENSLENC